MNNHADVHGSEQQGAAPAAENNNLPMLLLVVVQRVGGIKLFNSDLERKYTCHHHIAGNVCICVG